MPDWSDYQEQIAAYFRRIGMHADTNVTLRGVRTTHDVDVVVRASHVGFDLLWLVECKKWQRPVTKLHVLALREIVSDLGADRGVLMTEAGYQRGALEAAELTNVHLTSLTDLERTSSYAFGMAQLRMIQDRVDDCWDRYWNLSKQIRIEFGLRPDVFNSGYSGQRALVASEAALDAAFRGDFPVIYDELVAALEAFGSRGFDPSELAIVAHTPNQLSEHLDSVISELEAKLRAAEESQQSP